VIYDYKCPNCGGKMERGCLNAPSPGISWLLAPAKLWQLGEKLQNKSSGWWPFRSSSRPLRALRCRGCTLVIFWYTPVEQPKSGAKNGDSELDAFVHFKAQNNPERDSAIKLLLGDYRSKLERTPDVQLKQIAYDRALQQANLTQVIDFNGEESSREQLIEQFVAEYGEYLRAIPFEQIATMLKFRKADRDNDGSSSHC
jgi:hypothetical protein